MTDQEKSKIFAKYIDNLSGEYIDLIINKVLTISGLLYDERNLTQVIELHLQHEISRRSKMKQIKNLHQEIDNELNLMKSLLNQPIEVLRGNGKLYKLLKNLSMEEVHKLRHFVNIEREFELLDKENFEEMKRNRGSELGTSLTN